MWRSGSKRKVVETELATVLKNTLKGVEELTYFLDALEKLASTSLHVFTGGDEVLKLSLHGISLQSVVDSISAARLFKRDASAFFHPSLHNVAVFVTELDRYIRTTEKLCTIVEKRNDQNFRLVYLFQQKSMSGFVNQFSDCHDRMLQFLHDVEDCAIQLDKMKKGSRISSVAGSSVGATGGILTIIGLALAPVTAGVSLGLVMGGVALGITSGVNSAVTTITEVVVNKVQQTRASEGLQSFMQDMKSIQECLDEVTNQREETLGEDYGNAFVSGAKVGGSVGTIGKGIDVLVDGLEDVGQAALKGPAALSKSARAGFITLNALFLGLDIFFICKDSISLANGDKSEVSEFLRARVALLRSEINAWQTMCNSLHCGMPESEWGHSALEQPLNLLKETTEDHIDIFTICKDSISLAKGDKSEVSEFLRARWVHWRQWWMPRGGGLFLNLLVWESPVVAFREEFKQSMAGKLASTSLLVFTGEDEVLKLSLHGISLQSVADSISVARLFKRDAGAFFRPSLHNVAVFVTELDRYIRITEKLCTIVEKRNDQNFRLVYLFQQKSISGFVEKFSDCHDRMLQFLDDVEDSAIQLDKMKKGSRISNIAGSSVGATGGILTIIGLALAPVTAGVSLGLTLGGVALGITSGVNSAVTMITEVAVNKAQQTRAREGLQSFMQDMKSIQECLDEVANQREETLGEDYGNAFVSGAKVAGSVSTISKGIDILVDGLPDVGQVALKGPAALSKSVRAAFITLNAIFLGLDIFIICKDSISLANGDQSEVSEFLRARVALLRSELNAWQTMCNSLHCGMLESERGHSALEQPLKLLKKTTEDHIDSFRTSSPPVNTCRDVEVSFSTASRKPLSFSIPSTLCPNT
ncbi:hypothetical protein CRUP_033238, partial [Coryphaenoides rupestris]